MIPQALRSLTRSDRRPPNSRCSRSTLRASTFDRPSARSQPRLEATNEVCARSSNGRPPAKREQRERTLSIGRGGGKPTAQPSQKSGALFGGDVRGQTLIKLVDRAGRARGFPHQELGDRTHKLSERDACRLQVALRNSQGRNRWQAWARLGCRTRLRRGDAITRDAEDALGRSHEIVERGIPFLEGV